MAEQTRQRLEFEADLILYSGGYDFEGQPLPDRSVPIQMIDHLTGDPRHDQRVGRDRVGILRLCDSGRYVEAIARADQFIVV